MHLPDFIMAMPSLDVPFPETVVSTRAVRSEAGLVVFFHFHQDFSLPPHAHGPQWGTVVAGEVAMISIAHPDFREGLQRDAHAKGLIPRAYFAASQAAPFTANNG